MCFPDQHFLCPLSIRPYAGLNGKDRREDDTVSTPRNFVYWRVICELREYQGSVLMPQKKVAKGQVDPVCIREGFIEEAAWRRDILKAGKALPG